MNTQNSFSGASWYELAKNQTVLIIGLGGVGSWLSLFLSRIGCDIVTFDFDTVEERNIGGQLYGIEQINKTKEEAIADVLANFTGKTVVSEGKYEEDSVDHHIVFCCADDMDIRKLSFEKWKKYSKTITDEEVIPIFFEARMQMEYLEVYSVIKGRNEENYIKTLFPNDEAAELVCNIKATSHTGAITASMMTQEFINHVTNCKNKSNEREVPEKLVFLNQLMLLEL